VAVGGLHASGDRQLG